MNKKIEDCLWDDLETDEERIKFLESGRAAATGIIAPSMIAEIVSVFRRAQKVETDLDDLRMLITEYYSIPVQNRGPLKDDLWEILNRGAGE